VDVALAGGAKEVVLTGVQLGAWGKDFPEKKTLADLLDGVLSHSGVQRLRLSSIEPWDFERSWLSFWSDKRLCRHLHIPLQTGNDRILKAMGRPISSEGYRRLLDVIRAKIPGVAVTTDVIAGFPGESEHDFSITKDFITSIGFAGGHVFTYSPRPGTAAFNMKDQVPREDAKARNAALRAVFRDSGRAFRSGFLGEQMEVLWESGTRNQGAWVLSGLTDNYLRVYAVSKQNLWNQLSILRIVSEVPEKAAVEAEFL
jgi:threonylcarbamoyladenosine tRNA methylthiotransferase MtaB